MSGPLAGRGIVVTRPRPQAQGLALRIEQAGGRAHVYPAIAIEAVAEGATLRGVFLELERFDLVIFISPTAVTAGLNVARRCRGGRPWPPRVAVAAIGRGSRRALERQGFAGVLAPAGQADSEALLALPELQGVSGRRVLIVRGEGGREFLAEALRGRGAEVVYAETYRRARAPTDVAPLLALWARGEIDAVTVSSGEGLDNFHSMLGALGQRWMRDTPVFVPHARVAQAARALGLDRVVVTAPGDDAVLEALVAYFGGAK